MKLVIVIEADGDESKIAEYIDCKFYPAKITFMGSWVKDNPQYDVVAAEIVE